MGEIIITSCDIVKPSSPTPHTSKIQKLSLIDRTAPSFYFPLIFFYKNDQHYPKHPNKILRCLKQSLSKILTIFYPLAGTIHQNSYVDCNDTGVDFLEARVDTPLQHFLENPNLIDELKQLLPADVTSPSHARILCVKTTFFDCGGVSIAVCFSHKFSDTASGVAFMHAWAAAARRININDDEEEEEILIDIIDPCFDLAMRFPFREIPPIGEGMKREKMVTRRLIFDGEKARKLREEASSGEVKDPSRVEAVSAFLWRCFIQAAGKDENMDISSFTAAHVVNMRPRAAPPIPGHALGNCFTFAYADHHDQVSSSSLSNDNDDDKGGIGALVSRLRAAIRKVDGDYIDNVVKCDGNVLKPASCIFSSWLRFPVYEVDFGWGKPASVCTLPMPFMNLVVLMDTALSDGGVEAWINVRDHHFFQIFIQSNYNML